MFDAYLFDMDGLLLDTEALAWRSFIEAAQGEGVSAAEAEAFFPSLVGTSSALTRKMVTAYFQNIESERFFAAWSEANQRLIDQGIPLRPHVREVLDHLAGQGARMAVVTSTFGDRARHHLAQAGLLGYFEHVTGGDEVSANKPDPAPYLETAARLGADPARCAAFEDSDRGVTAAARAGCTAVQIPDVRPVDQPLPELGQIVAPDLRTALQMLSVGPTDPSN